MEFRDLRAQRKHLATQLDDAIDGVIDNARFIGGEPVASLERELADFVGVRRCISCANGTDALQLALMAWGIGAGDAVFVPDFTFFSSGEVVSAVGATPVFVDVCKETYNLDVNSLRNALSFVRDNTNLIPKAVVVVDLFGQPADYGTIVPLCQSEGLLMLEDGAQGFGGAINTTRACSFGDIATTSFFPAKPLGCYGDGGAIFTDNDEWAGLLRSYAVHGKGSMKYDNVRVGMNSRLDTLQAAILQVKLTAFAQYEIDEVNQRARQYDELLEHSRATTPIVLEGFLSSWAQYTVQLPSGTNRTALANALRNQGIPTMVYYPKPMHEQLAFAGRCLCPDGCPTTAQLCQSVLSLPMGPYLLDEDIELVARALDALL